MGYTTKSGDTWDTIAREVYGSEYYADHLMAANHGQIGTFIFSAGVGVYPPATARCKERPPAALEV